MDVRKSQRTPLSVFGLVRFFKSNNFCLKVFSGPARYIRFFFEDRCFSYATFSFFFHRSPPQFLPKMKRFVTLKDSSRFSARCDFKKIAGDLQKKFSKIFWKNFGKFLKKIQKIFSFNFLFVFKVSRWGRWVFCCFQLGKNGFRELCPSLQVFSGAVKLMKF